LLVENASDFTASELRMLFEEVSSPSGGVFLDLMNPIATFEDPVAVIGEFASRSPAGHIKDFALESIWTDDRYHRHGYTWLGSTPEKVWRTLKG
jgi:hypothetical protein